MNTEFLTSDTPVSEQAAAWFFELADGPMDRATRQEFVGWLKRSPQHIEAFLAIAVLDQELSELPGDLDEALARLASDRTGGKAVPLDNARNSATKPIRSRPSRLAWRGLGWVAAAGVTALVLVSGLGLLSPDLEAPAAVHRTDFGEQRSIVLRDGSIVTLNTRSEVAVRFGDAERRVELVSGEAMFDVSRDARRPFVVDTGTVTLRVLGTKFSVYRKAESIRLAVVEGVVRAVRKQAPGQDILVSAGEGAVATADGTIVRRDEIDLDKAIAWTERRLIFEDVRLEDVALEFNRYNRTPLVVQDPQLAERKITSVFFANDVSALIAFLELEPDVEVDYGADAIRIRSDH